ncbi:ATP-binding protein [Chromobacterium sp. IIBBL 290-4]|uniref:ATP-binding protein n=1 Tax=Chromobacterium sp. IIBBL 290-4 TaxID=2953890 RepID=UPI0020B8908D|nr:ATP-binding protein [Chromobacterium sp. IIBBL 290-4]UTH74443.1 ATP-binding protein [Chromobacterium sp. IIBBL 290-4]
MSYDSQLGEGCADDFIGDADRIRQVLLNLTGNAVKFTEHGSIRVTAEIRSDKDKTWLECRVEDSGIGIPKSAKAKLFHRFSQADASITRRYGGTGLGLAISRSLVELMQGQIGFDSEEGKGSAFYFSLPLTRPEPNR